METARSIPGRRKAVRGGRWRALGRGNGSAHLLLGVSLFLLPGLGLAGDEPGLQVETLARTTSSWDGAPLPAYPGGRPEITVLRIRIPPGTELPLHRHPAINAGYLLGGSLTVVTENGDTLHLKAGDAVVEVVDTWHSGRNDGQETAEIVVFYAGSEGAPITERKPE